MDIDTATKSLIDALRARMLAMNDEERVEVARMLMYGYCEACGSKRLPCYCTRDE